MNVHLCVSHSMCMNMLLYVVAIVCHCHQALMAAADAELMMDEMLCGDVAQEFGMDEMDGGRD